MDNRDDFLSVVVSFFFVGFFIGGLVSDTTKTRYQAAAYGNNGSIIVDQYTGEAWAIKEYDSDLRPITYSVFDKQNNRDTYTPTDEVRNKKNQSWWPWLKNFFGYKKKLRYEVINLNEMLGQENINIETLEDLEKLINRKVKEGESFIINGKRFEILSEE